MVTAFPKINKRIQIHSTTEIYEPLTPWSDSLEALSAVSAYLVLNKVSGTGRVRLGIQTCNNPDVTIQGASALSDTAYLSADGDTKFYRFDPNGAADGNIDANKKFRLVLLVSLSAAGVGSVDVTADVSWR